jgi:hypothetical protein
MSTGYGDVYRATCHALEQLLLVELAQYAQDIVGRTRRLRGSTSSNVVPPIPRRSRRMSWPWQLARISSLVRMPARSSSGEGFWISVALDFCNPGQSSLWR